MTVADALLAEARLAVPGVSVFDTTVDAVPPARYAVFYCDAGLKDSSSYGRGREDARYGFQVNAFGPTRESAEWVATRIRDRVTGTRISVAGVRAQLATDTFSGLLTHDDNVQQARVVQSTIQYTIQVSAA